ncbi:MAG: M23 family metallopeptidase [Anaerolineae bacterium]
MVLIVITVYAAYSVRRPITDNGGIINQVYLYGEESGGQVHRGVDFRHGTGTNVRSTDDGRVMAVREIVPDNQNTRGAFGNYVMIRHDRMHYDRTVGQMAYVYSIYAHLKYDSVSVNVDDIVSAGQVIAQSNDTGNSTLSHLHLQINLSTDLNRTDPEDWGWSQNTSRNPELWLEAFNAGGVQTANAVGKLTDVNGNPVGGKLIWGMQKPLAAEGDPTHNFQTARTYAYTWANADDLVVENFGTTDVQPGTYHLYARYPNGALYEDLGNHTFVAGRATFVGLFPAYLPDILSNYYGWNSTILVRNNSQAKVAQVNTSLLADDRVHRQNTDFIALNNTREVRFSNYCAFCRGSTLAVASQDQAVIVENRYSGGDYDGSAAVAYSAFDAGSATMYLPYAVYYPDAVTSGVPFVQYSRFTVQNTTTAAASLELKYINRGGVTDFTRSDTLVANSLRASQQVYWPV